MKLHETRTWNNYKKFKKVVGSSSTRCTTDIVIYWKLFNQYNFKSILEIGVYQGLSSGLMLESSPECNLIGVDPELQLDTFNLIYPESIKNRAKFILSESKDYYTDAKFDFILIDGDHSFESAYNDLLKFIPCLTPQGIIAIDDYKLVGVSQAMQKIHLENFGLVPFFQAEQTEFWHYPNNDRADFLDNLLLDDISKFIFLYNIDINESIVLKAKTVLALTDNIDLFDEVLKLYNV